MAPRHQILVVEDDPGVLRLTRTMLEHGGYLTEGVTRGDQAIELLQQKRFDLVCLDLMLPTVSGFEVCAFLRQLPEQHGVRVLVISARALPLDRADALDAGADAFLTKPFTRQKLLSTVNELLSLNAPRPAASGGAP